MKTLLLGSFGSIAVAALALAIPAGAADLPPTMFHMAPQSVSAPSYDWTGFYIGGHIGGAWDHRDAEIFSSAGALLASGSTNSSGVMGGGQIGFNFALAPNWIAGIEADVSGADLRNSVIGAAGLGQRDNDIDVFGTVRGRLGYAWNNWLLFGTGGFAWGDAHLTRTQLVGTVNNAIPGTVESASAIGVGWAAGAGLEWGFARNWAARIEYLHLDLGTQSFLFPLAAQRIDAKATIDVARFGLSYKFDWGAPLRTKY
jgi:outer membrane immunogenic protein